jgi:hypothetical protein
VSTDFHLFFGTGRTDQSEVQETEPPDWKLFRDRWEYSHQARSSLGNFVARIERRYGCLIGREWFNLSGCTTAVGTIVREQCSDLFMNLVANLPNRF